AAHCEGLYSCLDYYQAVDDPFSQKLLAQYDALYPGEAKFTGGSACSGLYRGLRLWAAAVSEVGSLDQADVVAALDRAAIAEGPAGRAQLRLGSGGAADHAAGRTQVAAAGGAAGRSLRRLIQPTRPGRATKRVVAAPAGALQAVRVRDIRRSRGLRCHAGAHHPEVGRRLVREYLDVEAIRGCAVQDEQLPPAVRLRLADEGRV